MISWLSIVLIIAVFAFSIWLIYKYASKKTPYHILGFVFIGYFFSFFVVVVLPFDVYTAIAGNSNSSLYDMWLVVYWVSFALCWFLLPMMKEIEMAGEGSFLPVRLLQDVPVCMFCITMHQELCMGPSSPHSTPP